MSFVTPVALTGNELLQGVRLLYTYTSEASLLTKALEWAKRSVDLYPMPPTFDMYAKVLYKLANKDEALVWEQKAIDASRKQKYFEKTFEEVLRKMKNGEENIPLY
jgi:hypothetical protein